MQATGYQRPNRAGHTQHQEPKGTSKAADREAVFKVIDPKTMDKEEREAEEPEIPGLFLYSQLLLAVSKNDAKYATTGTPAKFWAVWREEVDKELAPIVNRRLRQSRRNGCSPIATGCAGPVRRVGKGAREVTAQDRALYGLCRPERLLELIWLCAVRRRREEDRPLPAVLHRQQDPGADPPARQRTAGGWAAWSGTRRAAASR